MRHTAGLVRVNCDDVGRLATLASSREPPATSPEDALGFLSFQLCQFHCTMPLQPHISVMGCQVTGLLSHAAMHVQLESIHNVEMCLVLSQVWSSALGLLKRDDIAE